MEEYNLYLKKQKYIRIMKKLLLSLIALTIISISSCKKDEGASPQIKNGIPKVAGDKTLSRYD